MRLIIRNAHKLAALDIKLVGSAVKIISAGGSKLNEDEAKRAAGTTRYWWMDNSARVLELVSELELEAAA